MSIYKIFKNDEEINRIVADKDFVSQWAQENGYTFEREPDPEPVPEPPQETPVSGDDLLSALLGLEVNSSGGGGVIFSSPVKHLLSLGQERYNALSNFLHVWGFCGGVACD